MKQSLVRTSKFLSRVLRHKPGSIGIELDANGWTSVDVLLTQAAAAGRSLSRADLEDVVATNDKQRFSFSDDGSRIRANQGHSVKVDLGLLSITPPDLLFHGTVERFVSAIRAQGLLAQKRHHVHLSPNREIATSVGKRRGEPIVLEVCAGAMHAAGYEFYRSANGVWLTERVPPEYIKFFVD
ncbi:MAG: RNA 2'-phosphotransferase [Gammaproteobacteria bacterium]|nr:RNA 2'-phosphotransferase [Gammaproteobacteria bacterium]